MTTCRYCGKEMNLGWTRQRVYCSDECRNAYYYTRENTECTVCGKKLVGHQRYFCSAECRNKSQKQTKQARYKTFRVKPKVRRKPKMSIAEINAKARLEGLNYGQYVAKYGL